jgi:hypothetical protein
VSRAEPGQQVEVSAVLRAPTIPGRYQAFFRLADADRTPFGARLWADLFVLAEPSAPSAAPVSASVIPAPVTAPAVVDIPVQIVRAVEQSPVVSSPKPTAPVVAAEPINVPVVVVQSAPAASSMSLDAPVVAPVAAGKYALAQSLLEEMGFRNRELNLFLLESNNGDVPTVAAWLLERMK